MKKTASTRA